MPAKNSSKTGKKVIDIKAPGDSQPSASSRPIIVSNRPLATDPMVNSAPEIEASSDETALVSRGRKIIPPSEAKAEADGDDQPSASDESGSAAASDKSAPTADELVKKLEAHQADSTASADSDQAEADASDDDKPDDVSKNSAETDDDASTETSSDEPTENTGDAADDASDDTDKPKSADEEVKAEAAEAKRQAELDELVDSQKYFVPVGAVRRRHDRYWLTLVLLIVLALVVLDILFDSGYLKINGFNPPTNFFNN